MAEGKKAEKKKLSIDETMRRMRPLFIMMMMFPLIGMIAAMAIIYIIQPKNLLLLESLIFASMAFFVVASYFFYKRMGNFTGKKPDESHRSS
jgi:positive regulator of sigma E activity